MLSDITPQEDDLTPPKAEFGDTSQEDEDDELFGNKTTNLKNLLLQQIQNQVRQF